MLLLLSCLIEIIPSVFESLSLDSRQPLLLFLHFITKYIEKTISQLKVEQL